MIGFSIHFFTFLVNPPMKALDKRGKIAYTNLYKYIETVEAGIKIHRALTESRGAENPAERSVLNGPPRAQGKATQVAC